MAYGWDQGSFPNGSWPMPPFNVEAVSPLFVGTIDLRWDNPATLSANTPWTIIGVNIYRSDSGERGPYFRLNGYPLGGTFYRDYTNNITISRELVDWDTAWVYKGDSPSDYNWVFRTRHQIVKGFPGIKSFASSPFDVVLNIDGVDTFVRSVHGESREVSLIVGTSYDPVTQRVVQSPLPTEDSVVQATYKTNQNEIRDDLDRKIAYRVTSVGLAMDGVTLVETPLEYCQPIFYIRTETLDYIWREAVKRNNWILEQGGERVKLFIRKVSGQICECVTDSKKASYIKQPRNRCTGCLGSGFVGGFEGPYDIIIAPDDSDRKTAQSNWGRYVENIYEVWMGPTPLVTQRDFIMKQSGEAFSIGPTRKPTNRGNILQQHFSINSLDLFDIRYRVPVDGLEGLPWPQTRTTVWPGESVLVYPHADFGPMHQMTPSEHSPQVYPDNNTSYQSTPQGSEKENIGDSREHRGRTSTWRNQNY